MIKRRSYHNSAKSPSTWVIFENICFWPTPRKKERDLGELQKKKNTVRHLKNSKYPFGNKFIDCVLAKWTPPRYNHNKNIEFLMYLNSLSLFNDLLLDSWTVVIFFSLPPRKFHFHQKPVSRINKEERSSFTVFVWISY